jgi:hypothetical protein
MERLFEAAVGLAQDGRVTRKVVALSAMPPHRPPSPSSYRALRAKARRWPPAGFPMPRGRLLSSSGPAALSDRLGDRAGTTRPERGEDGVRGAVRPMRGINQAWPIPSPVVRHPGAPLPGGSEHGSRLRRQGSRHRAG